MVGLDSYAKCTCGRNSKVCNKDIDAGFYSGLYTVQQVRQMFPSGFICSNRFIVEQYDYEKDKVKYRGVDNARRSRLNELL